MEINLAKFFLFSTFLPRAKKQNLCQKINLFSTRGQNGLVKAPGWFCKEQNRLIIMRRFVKVKKNILVQMIQLIAKQMKVQLSKPVFLVKLPPKIILEKLHHISSQVNQNLETIKLETWLLFRMSCFAHNFFIFLYQSVPF